jgi:hypothetical protein
MNARLSRRNADTGKIEVSREPEPAQLCGRFYE